MLFNPLVDEINARHLMELADAERESRHSYFYRRFAVHNGIITDHNEAGYNEELCKQFFPRGKTESVQEYRERQKVWVPFGRIMLSRIVNLILKGNNQVRFEAAGEADEQAAETAQLAIESDFEYNKWSLLLPELITDMLAIGEVSTWPDYRRYNPASGEKFDNGGRIKYTKRYPWIAEPIVHPERVTEVIGSISMYEISNSVVTPAVTAKMNLSGGTKRRIELWLAKHHDTETGEVLHNGCYAVFDNEREVGDPLWRESNRYGVNPVTHWISPFVDETQYRGCSYYDLFMDMWLKLVRVASSEAASLQYMVPFWKMFADLDNAPANLEFRQNSLLRLPQSDPQPELSQTQRGFTLDEEREFKKFLVNTMGEAGGYSGDFLTGMEGVGKVSESGVARKIVYEKTVDMVNFLRSAISETLEELITKSIAIRNMENGGSFVDLSKVRPVVIWDDDLIPLSDLESLEYDLKLFANGLTLENDLVIKYNSHIRTQEQAEQFIDNRRQNTQANVTASSPRSPLEALLNANS